MNVAPEDGFCCDRGGAGTIIDHDDGTLTVECRICGNGYDVVPDTSGDNPLGYVLQLRTRDREEEVDGPDDDSE